jgi:hypothetical protein
MRDFSKPSFRLFYGIACSHAERGDELSLFAENDPPSTTEGEAPDAES